MKFILVDQIISQIHIKTAKTATEIITTTVELTNSRRVGHETFFNSSFTSFIKLKTLLIFFNAFMPRFPPQARRDSNPQQAVLETAALPIGATGLGSLKLLVFRVFSTPVAIFGKLQALRILLLVL